MFKIHPEFGTPGKPSDEEIYFNPKSMEGFGKVNLMDVLFIAANPMKTANQDFKFNAVLDGENKDYVIAKTGDAKSFKTKLNLNSARSKDVICKFTMTYTGPLTLFFFLGSLLGIVLISFF